MTTSAQRSPKTYARLSIVAALATIGLKSGAYWITGSVGLLSDAMESGVNLVAALVALWMLTLAALPPTRSICTATPRPSTSPAAWKR